MVRFAAAMSIGLLISTGSFADDKPAAEKSAAEKPVADKAASESEFKKLQGTWKPVSAVLRGQEIPEDIVNSMKLEMEPGKYRVDVNGAIDKGTLSLAPDKSPKQMDVKGTEGPNNGKTYWCIYEFAKDGKLRICYGMDQKTKARPKEFKSEEGTKTLFIVYEKKS